MPLTPITPLGVFALSTDAMGGCGPAAELVLPTAVPLTVCAFAGTVTPTDGEGVGVGVLVGVAGLLGVLVEVAGLLGVLAFGVADVFPGMDFDTVPVELACPPAGVFVGVVGPLVGPVEGACVADAFAVSFALSSEQPSIHRLMAIVATTNRESKQGSMIFPLSLNRQSICFI